MAALNNLDYPIIRHGACNYHLVRRIGTWGPDFTNTIYETYIFPRLGIPQRDHMAIKLVDRTRGDHYYNFAEDELMKSLTVPALPPNILNINSFFDQYINGVQTLCILLPFEYEVISIRSLISESPKFAHGIPQDCIATVLDGVLRGLENIHYWNRRHDQITAGNIYYRHGDDNIKLAYAAAVYERVEFEMPSPPEFVSDEEADDDEPPPLEEDLLPMNQLTDWGRAPEVEKHEELINEMTLYLNQSEKSDVWLVGIAALEMAYGKIKVMSREELLYIGRYISKNRRMPNTWEELRAKYLAYELKNWEKKNKKKNEDKKTKNGRKGIKILKIKCPEKFLERIVAKVVEPRRFTRLLVNFVAYCLRTDPAKRPSAFVMRCHKFFDFNVQSMDYIDHVMIQELDIPVARVFDKMKLED